jgi:hypothetical protein
MANRFQTSLAGAVAAALLASLTFPVEAREWGVEGRLKGKPKKESSIEFQKAKDVSGIACSREAGFPRPCLVIDDEVQWAQVVILHESRIVAGQTIQLIGSALGGKPLELDGEGVAYADGYFYVIGSHGASRKSEKNKAKREARIAASSQLVRFRLDGDDITADGRLKISPRIETTAKLRKALTSHPALKAFAERDLDEKGLTIEGVAIRDGILYAGLRAPTLAPGRATVASVPVEALFDGNPGVPELTLHSLTVGDGNGIRDLALYRGEFVVLVGSAPGLDDEEPGRYAIYRWAGRGDVEGPGADVPVYPAKDGDKSKFPKPEAILPLEETRDGLRILVIYEGAEEGRPRDLTIR